ncbi:MAG: tRNA pseudouridine(38-40) synthase TruA [Haloferacaceae archaeon]
MRAFRLAYDGRPFYGFQRQPRVPTVEGAVLDALADLGVTDDPTDVPGGYAAAGRTDAGVSARAQTVAFEGPEWLTPAALSGALPATVRAWAHADVPPEFHATHDATRRAYVYHLHAPPGRTDDAAVRAATDRLSGRHDFHNLTTDETGTERELSLAAERDGDFLTLTAAADGFARGLVRRLASVLAAVGRGEGDERWLDRLLSPAPVDGPDGVGPAPPEPLVLADVDYADVAFAVDDAAAADARAALGARRVAARRADRALGTVLDGLSL